MPPPPPPPPPLPHTHSLSISHFSIPFHGLIDAFERFIFFTLIGKSGLIFKKGF